MDGLTELDPSAIGIALGTIAAGLLAFTRILRWDKGWKELLAAAKEDADDARKELRKVRREATGLRDDLQRLRTETEKTYEYLRRIRELEDQVHSLEADIEAKEIENEQLENELIDVKGALAAQLKIFPSPMLEAGTIEGGDEGVQEAH